MISVQDVNTELFALIDKGEFAFLPPSGPLIIPGDSSRSKSIKERNKSVKDHSSRSKSK